MRWNEKVK